MYDGKGDLTACIRRVVRSAVADGSVEPDDALAAVVAVAAKMVGEVRDDAARRVYVELVIEMFPRAVEYVHCGGGEVGHAAFEAKGQTRQ